MILPLFIMMHVLLMYSCSKSESFEQSFNDATTHHSTFTQNIFNVPFASNQLSFQKEKRLANTHKSIFYVTRLKELQEADRLKKKEINLRLRQQQKKENDIYVQHLVRRMEKSSFLNDFLTMRY